MRRREEKKGLQLKRRHHNIAICQTSDTLFCVFVYSFVFPCTCKYSFFFTVGFALLVYRSQFFSVILILILLSLRYSEAPIDCLLAALSLKFKPTLFAYLFPLFFCYCLFPYSMRTLLLIVLSLHAIFSLPHLTITALILNHRLHSYLIIETTIPYLPLS